MESRIIDASGLSQCVKQQKRGTSLLENPGYLSFQYISTLGQVPSSVAKELLQTVYREAPFIAVSSNKD